MASFYNMIRGRSAPEDAKPIAGDAELLTLAKLITQAPGEISDAEMRRLEAFLDNSRLTSD